MVYSILHLIACFLYRILKSFTKEQDQAKALQCTRVKDKP